ncbi:MAG: sulfate adenylyltransferase, partial [Dehalococcoidia bacterium]|nr:sulfate adenylyltransferase [Dehalococcoidia bacterium]
MTGLGQPYGGTLIDLLATGASREDIGREAATLPSIEMDSRHTSDFELLVNGGFSPLDGFMGEADYRSVVDKMTLANGLPWPVPVTLAVSEPEAARLATG